MLIVVAAAENGRKAKEGEGDVNQEVGNETVRQDERVVEIEIIGMLIVGTIIDDICCRYGYQSMQTYVDGSYRRHAHRLRDLRHQ